MGRMPTFVELRFACLDIVVFAADEAIVLYSLLGRREIDLHRVPDCGHKVFLIVVASRLRIDVNGCTEGPVQD